MAKYVLAIIKDVDKLRERSEEVAVVGTNLIPDPAVKQIIKDLKDTLHSNPELVSLAAPQLGKQKRIFCIKFANGDIRTFINPLISKTEGLHLAREINPSLPGRTFIVPRHDRVIGIYQTPTGAPEENIFEGVVAEVFQQMVQLLDGVMLSDFALEIFEDFDKAPKKQQKEVLNMYLDKLKAQAELLNSEIEADEDLKQTRDAIDFMTNVATGKVVLEEQEELKDKVSTSEEA